MLVLLAWKRARNNLEYKSVYKCIWVSVCMCLNWRSGLVKHRFRVRMSGYPFCHHCHFVLVPSKCSVPMFLWVKWVWYRKNTHTPFLVKNWYTSEMHRSEILILPILMFYLDWVSHNNIDTLTFSWKMNC